MILLAGCEITIGDGDSGTASGTDPDTGPGGLFASPVTSEAPARVLGPDGLGPLRIGMTLDEAAATGAFDKRAETKGACMSDTGTNRITVGWSGRLGISRLTADNVHTPEGIGAGSTYAQVKKAYPKPAYPQDGSLDEDISLMGTVWTAVPNRPKAMYVFRFVPDTVVRGHLDAAKVQIVVLKLKAERNC